MQDTTPEETGAALYVVATPIGNLGDISPRARQVLDQADRILAEDTRRTGQLLHALGIQTPMLSCHEHNERQRIQQVLTRLAAGERLALVSDAGTPLISDPGFVIVRAVAEAGYPVIAVPGPSALTAALSIAGLPTDRFVFEGFLPAKAGARHKRLEQLATESRTLVFYESSHRILDLLQDLVDVLGGQRQVVVLRELTKRYEQVLRGSAAGVLARLQDDADARRGEFVVVVAGAEDQTASTLPAARQLLELLLAEMSPTRAAALAAKLTGQARRELYKQALEISGKSDGTDS